jgi:hypothetical protein
MIMGTRMSMGTAMTKLPRNMDIRMNIWNMLVSVLPKSSCRGPMVLKLRLEADDEGNLRRGTCQITRDEIGEKGLLLLVSEGRSISP